MHVISNLPRIKIQFTLNLPRIKIVIDDGFLESVLSDRAIGIVQRKVDAVFAASLPLLGKAELEAVASAVIIRIGRLGRGCGGRGEHAHHL